MDWLEDLAPFADEGRRFSEECTFLLSSQSTPFNVFIMHGNDSRRMIAALRQSAPLLNSKLKIALMTESDPPARTALLSAGFDDVLDLRTSISEARARIRSCLRRMQHARTAWLGTQVMNAALDAVAVAQMGVDPSALAYRLTVRERALFSCLYSRIGRVASYAQLLAAYEDRALKDGRKSMHVALWGLRKKLDKVFEIRAHPNLGYELKLKVRDVNENGYAAA